MLVIIGLIVGGVLVGRDLIAAAGVRAQISQIEKYQQAVNTFRGKYGYLPGDIRDPEASRFGFVARSSLPALTTAYGNGLLEGFIAYPPLAGQIAGYCGTGENLLIWVDLTTAGLVDGNFMSASGTEMPSTLNISTYVPVAKLGSENYVETYSSASGINYFSIRHGNYYWQAGGVILLSSFGQAGGLHVSEAYSIDSKVDDGRPGSGSVTSKISETTLGYWMDGTATVTSASLPTTAKPASATTCTDNGNAAGVEQTYSINQNAGRGMNCALSFKFQ